MGGFIGGGAIGIAGPALIAAPLPCPPRVLVRHVAVPQPVAVPVR